MKKVLFLLLFFCLAFSLKSTAVVLVQTDSLVQILKLKDANLRERKLVKFIQDDFGGIPMDSIAPDKILVNHFLANYYVSNKEAYDLYIESIHQNRLLNSNTAQSYLLKAIEIAAKSRDHYLLYTFLSHVAFIQTYNGNAIGAIASFGEAKKEAMVMKDAYLEVIIDINISDIYYRYNFYSQSLDYLRQAQELVIGEQMTDPRLRNIIYYNKCENYFRMNAKDSLIKYNALLRSSKSVTNKLYTYVNRTQYFVYLLDYDYKKAIQIITALPADKKYRFETIDKLSLADVWVNTSEPDSAKKVIDGLLADKAQNNHPEIKYHLYELLGEIAGDKNDNELAANNYKMALEQAKDNVAKLLQVGDISSRMKIDEIQANYFKKDKLYKRERVILIFIIIVALFIIAIVVMFYRNVRQKRHYEKLLFTAKREEISYINSHDIRRHLTNILGIIDVLKHSDNKEKEYLTVEKHLLYSAEQLDKSIKNISEKLDEEPEG